MNYYGPKELAASFRTVRKNTITIAEEIGEDQYGFKAAPETRSVAQALAHIALSTRMPMQVHATERRVNMEGFDFPGFFGKLMTEEQAQRDKQQIITMLREEGERFATWVESVPDDYLGEQVGFPSAMKLPSKSRFEMLLSVKEHEMHHRAQLMLMERMIGIVPHLTREMQSRIAAMQASQATA